MICSFTNLQQKFLTDCWLQLADTFGMNIRKCKHKAQKLSHYHIPLCLVSTFHRHVSNLHFVVISLFSVEQQTKTKIKTLNWVRIEGWGVSARWTNHCFDSFPTAQCSQGSRLSLPEIPRGSFTSVLLLLSLSCFMIFSLSVHPHTYIFFCLNIPQIPFYTSLFSLSLWGILKTELEREQTPAMLCFCLKIQTSICVFEMLKWEKYLTYVVIIYQQIFSFVSFWNNTMC